MAVRTEVIARHRGANTPVEPQPPPVCRNDLRQLGFLRSSGKGGAVEEDEDLDGDEDTVPEPQPTPVA